MVGTVRTFQTSRSRRTVVLNGLWDFSTAGKNEEGEEVQAFPEDRRRRISVPGCWEKSRGLEGYRGSAWYRTWFETRGLPVVRITFHGVSHTARVFVDGVRVGAHYGAYTPFSVVLPDLSEGRHELVVKVDNRFTDDGLLHLETYDWYTYGGIIRPVVVEEVASRAFVERLRVIPQSIAAPASVEVEATLRTIDPPHSGPNVEGGSEVAIAIADGDQVCSEALWKVDWDGEQGVARGKLEIPRPKLWSPTSPHLYHIRAAVSDRYGTDDLIERFGLRKVEVCDRQVLLNGEPIRLLGFNRHEDHPDWGPALPESVMIRDLDLIQDTGANLIRGSHYPNSSLFLDLLDERGLLFWEEATSWQQTADHLNSAAFQRQLYGCIDEMIQAHMNHPSIIMWGLLNECATHKPTAKDAVRAFVGRIRRNDPSRPVTYASNHPFDDVCLDFVDIVSFNQYVGWYRGTTEELDERLRTILAWLDEVGQGQKPLIVSEFGAGALPGFHSLERRKWSEEYQADLLDKSLAVFLAEPRVAGTAVWQFCDVRTSDRLFATRPRLYNNKGIVDEHRRPKLAFEAVKRRYLEAH